MKIYEPRNIKLLRMMDFVYKMLDFSFNNDGFCV